MNEGINKSSDGRVFCVPAWTFIMSRKNLKSGQGLRGSGVLQAAFQLEVDFYRVIDLKEEVARILETPIDERHVELRNARPMVSGKFRLDRHGQFVFAAV